MKKIYKRSFFWHICYVKLLIERKFCKTPVDKNMKIPKTVIKDLTFSAISNLQIGTVNTVNKAFPLNWPWT